MKSGFVPITIDTFIKSHMKLNTSGNPKNIRKCIQASLKAYQNGVKCDCGDSIWVIGSSFVENACFTCITGEADPSDDVEIKDACYLDLEE